MTRAERQATKRAAWDVIVGELRYDVRHRESIVVGNLPGTPEHVALYRRELLRLARVALRAVLAEARKHGEGGA